MRQPFHMTGGLRMVSTIITTLLRLGLPAGPSILLSVRGRTSGKIYTIPIALVEKDGTRFLVAAFGVSTSRAALTARSRAMRAREPGQIRKEAALSGSGHVPRISLARANRDASARGTISTAGRTVHPAPRP